MQIYEGYYSDKRYQFIYSTDEIKEKVKSIFEYYEIEKVILNMHKKGYSLEQIMDATELEAAELETIIEKLK